jgi:hypothetical protein
VTPALVVVAALQVSAAEGVFPLEAPPPPAAEDRRAQEPDRVTTYVRPQSARVWVALGAGGSLRAAPTASVAPQVDLFAATPFLVWKGAFEPGIVPHARVAWTGVDRTVAGIGVGVARLDQEWLKAQWFYLPSAVLGVTGARSGEVGLRQAILAHERHWLHASIGHTWFFAAHEHVVSFELGVDLAGGGE